MLVPANIVNDHFFFFDQFCGLSGSSGPSHAGAVVVGVGDGGVDSSSSSFSLIALRVTVRDVEELLPSTGLVAAESPPDIGPSSLFWLVILRVTRQESNLKSLAFKFHEM